MYYTDNPINDWNNYCANQERELAKHVQCSCCDERITDEYCFEINGEYICESCMNSYYKVETPVED